MRLPDGGESEYEVGATLNVSVFSEKDSVDITGVSKGKGFAGGMKRHGFGGFPASHGCERKHRAPGSISSHGQTAGGSGGPKKGKRMPGHMGNVRVTSKNHNLLVVDEEKDLLVVRGGIPGAPDGYCIIRSTK
jgi:large subunit ribosomal protein L3